MLKHVDENIKNNFALIFFYTLDIRNIIFNPKFYQHFLPSLEITYTGIYKYLTKILTVQPRLPWIFHDTTSLISICNL